MDQPHSFIAWICPKLKPYMNSDNDFIYFEGDEVKDLFFIKQGQCGFVLPKHGNLSYIDIKEGQMFGIIDVVHSMLK